ncbi:queuosine precursor transporter [Bradyrhizobium sp.]|uniref:queuosine precursor transporter n=1 Tax=Bradyrhizobium sp. TaxID=376 RepID=UPI0025B7CC04|nr:queuosine precursor transporter [Bradyrhizobium sp.]
MPRSLFLFAVVYGGMTCIAGVLGNKQVALPGGLAVEAGIFAFLWLVMLSSAVAELHGRAVADRLVRFGFVPLLVSMALIALVLALPPSPKMEPERLAGFELVLGQSGRLMAAGLIAYGVSQTLNVHLFSRMRGAGDGGAMLWLRGAVAGVLSQIVDTLLFITIAFYGVFPIADLLIGQALTKALLSALVVPPLIIGLVRLGRRLDA